MITQNQFNNFMENYEVENYSFIYDVGVTLIRVLTLSMLTYLVATTL